MESTNAEIFFISKKFGKKSGFKAVGRINRYVEKVDYIILLCIVFAQNFFYSKHR